MLTPEQLQLRSKGIGASEAGAVLGVDPWTKPIDVYLRKRGLVDDSPGSFHSDRGVYLEPALRTWASDKIGIEFSPVRQTSTHPEARHVMATTDGIAKDAVLELKSPGPRTQQEWGEDDNAPDRYVIQLAQQMAVYGKPQGFLCALVGGDLRVYRFERNERLESGIIEGVERFWTDHIEAGVPPEPDGTDAYHRYLAERWTKTSGELLQANGPDEDLMHQLMGAVDAEDQAAQRIALVRQRIEQRIGDADGLVSPVLGKIYWRRNKDRDVIDWRAVAEEMGATAEVVARHTVTKPGSRVFRHYFKKEAQK